MNFKLLEVEITPEELEEYREDSLDYNYRGLEQAYRDLLEYLFLPKECYYQRDEDDKFIVEKINDFSETIIEWKTADERTLAKAMIEEEIGEELEFEKIKVICEDKEYIF